DIDNFPARLVQPPQRISNEVTRLRPSKCLVGVRIGVTDISKASSAKQRIGNGVENDIGIAVADEAARARYGDSSQNQRTALFQPMRIMTNPDAHIPCKP